MDVRWSGSRSTRIHNRGDSGKAQYTPRLRAGSTNGVSNPLNRIVGVEAIGKITDWHRCPVGA